MQSAESELNVTITLPSRVEAGVGQGQRNNVIIMLNIKFKNVL